MVKDNRKKTNLIINPEFQFRFLKQIFVLYAAVMIVVFFVASWLIDPLLTEISSLDLPPEHSIWIVVDNFRSYASLMGGLLFLAISCFFIMAALIISHKVAGPLKNLQNSMARMAAAKKLTKVYFRKGDFFKSLEDDFNTMVDQLENKN